MNAPKTPEQTFPPRYWINDSHHHLDEEAPDCCAEKPIQGPPMWVASFKEYLSLQEHEALLQRERELRRGLLEAAENLLKTAEENEPEFVAHKRYTYADCQQIFKPIADAIERLDNSLEAYRASAKE